MNTRGRRNREARRLANLDESSASHETPMNQGTDNTEYVPVGGAEDHQTNDEAVTQAMFRVLQ